MPTVPGYQDVATDDEKGSDLGAAMWQNWPYSVVESRGLFKYGELPLWNRYNSTGLPLLGQGLSMCADPLQLLVLVTGGSSGGVGSQIPPGQVPFRLLPRALRLPGGQAPSRGLDYRRDALLYRLFLLSLFPSRLLYSLLCAADLALLV